MLRCACVCVEGGALHVCVCVCELARVAYVHMCVKEGVGWRLRMQVKCWSSIVDV